MNNILPFDELNAFRLRLLERFPDGKLVVDDDYDDILDWMLDIFLLAIANSVFNTNKQLGGDWVPPIEDIMMIVDKKVVGKTWKQRVGEYFANGGSVDDLVRIAETETHRDLNEAALVTASHNGARTKTWQTMLDDRVRDPHVYLEGVSVGINDDFYAYDGNHAPAPGMFGVPELDVNCRCFLSFGK